MARRGKNKSEPKYEPENRSTAARQESEKNARKMKVLSSKARRVVGAYYALPQEYRDEIKHFLANNG